MTIEYCNATPAGKSWPVCSRDKYHDGPHESADFIWQEGDSEARAK